MRLLAVLFGLVVLATPGAVVAQDTREERVVLAERAIRAARAEELTAMSVQIAQAMGGSEMDNMPPEVRAVFVEVFDEVMADMNTRLVAGMVQIYADTFTAEELQAFAEFYESPIGQSIVQKNMDAAPRFMETVQAMMPDMIRQLINGMCDRMQCSPEERRQAISEALAGAGLREA